MITRKQALKMCRLAGIRNPVLSNERKLHHIDNDVAPGERLHHSVNGWSWVDTTAQTCGYVSTVGAVFIYKNRAAVNQRRLPFCGSFDSLVDRTFRRTHFS